MNIELTKDEVALILDGLSQLPLAKAYNTFQKVLSHYQAAEQAEQRLSQGELNLGGTD
jgi:hypothetical protein